MKKITFILTCLIFVVCFNIKAQDVTETYLTNPSFETGDLTGWTVTGADGYTWFGAASDCDGTQDGTYNCGVWNRTIGDVEWSQTITDLPNGFYKVGCLMSVTDVTSWTDGVTKRISTQRLFANNKSLLYGKESDYSAANLAILAATEEYSFAGMETSPSEAGPFLPIATIIEVTDGNLVVGLRTNGDVSEYAFDFQGQNSDRGYFKFDALTLANVSDLIIQSLSIGGQNIEIDPTNVYLHTMDIAMEETEAPEIIATVGEGVVVEVIPPASLPGTAEIVLTAPDESNSLSYFVTFTKNSDATLKSIASNAGTLSPEFERTNTEYDLYVPYGITSIQLTATPTVENASILVLDATSGAELDLNNPITWDAEDAGIDLSIIVTSMDESTEITYDLYVSYDSEAATATIEDITSSVGNLTTEVDPVVTEYELVVPKGTTSVDISGTPGWELASVSGGGTVTLTDGTGSTTLTVTSEDKSATKDYTITIRESYVVLNHEYFVQHTEAELVLGESENGYLQLFEPVYNEPTQYLKFIESGIGGKYFIQNQNNRYLSNVIAPVYDMVFIDELKEDLDSCRWSLEPQEDGSFRIITGAREKTANYYVGPNWAGLGGVFNDKWPDNPLIYWNIKEPLEVVDPYNTYLDTLTVDQGASISPEVAKDVTDYYVVLPVGGLSTLNVGALAIDENAVITGAGAVDVSAGSGSFDITVTAPDPTYSRTVTIHYMTDTDLILKHSYTFSDGTAKDIIGGADGTVIGGSITNGKYTGSVVGDYIELPAEEIAINTYPSLTLEVYVEDDNSTTNANVNTAVVFFGRTNDANYAEDYYYTSMKCSSVLSVSDGANPWDFEQGVNTGIDLHDDNRAHHLVTTISNDSLVFYVDGYVMDTTYFSVNNCIANLSNEFAYILKNGYIADNTWLGSVLEYNIYSGVMDAQTIAIRSLNSQVEDDSKDATLSDLKIDGVTIDGFNGAILEYTVNVETLPTEVLPIAKGEGSTVEITSTATTIPGQTTILVTAADGNTNTYIINYDIADAINKIKDLEIKVYPTVSNGSFTVTSEGTSTIVTVYGLTGRIIDQFNTNSSAETFNIEQKGMFIVKVNSEGLTKLFKVIKK